MSRLNYVALDKKAYGIIGEMLKHIHGGGIDVKLLHLVYLRVSQINGCPYCIDMHYKDAIEAGAEPRAINALVCWPHMPFFTAKEKAAFAWAEAVTRLEKQYVPDAAYAMVKEHFTDNEIVTLTHAISEMNALNRLAIAFAVHPEI